MYSSKEDLKDLFYQGLNGEVEEGFYNELNRSTLFDEPRYFESVDQYRKDVSRVFAMREEIAEHPVGVNGKIEKGLWEGKPLDEGVYEDYKADRMFEAIPFKTAEWDEINLRERMQSALDEIEGDYDAADEDEKRAYRDAVRDYEWGKLQNKRLNVEKQRFKEETDRTLRGMELLAYNCEEKHPGSVDQFNELIDSLDDFCDVEEFKKGETKPKEMVLDGFDDIAIEEMSFEEADFEPEV